ncbi:MAG: ABC transporter substrate-binding protein [Gammaproteobacteria bacterium]
MAGLAALALCVVTEPLPLADAQPRSSAPRIGVLTSEAVSATDSAMVAFQRAMRDLGYIEGQTVYIEYRDGQGRSDRFTELVTELIRLGTDVMVVASTPAARAAKQATERIPVVFVLGGNPVETGLVESLARPGGNLTGLSSAIDDEFSGKWVELLKAAVPKLSRVVALRNPDTAVTASFARHQQSAARALGLRLETVLVRRPDELDGAFATMIRVRTGGVIVDPTVFFGVHHKRVVDLAAKHRLPAVYGHRVAVDAGGLMFYGASFPDVWRRAALVVDKILKGARPATIPVEQATKFEMVINLKTAKALGLKIPPSLLLRADALIE